MSGPSPGGLQGAPPRGPRWWHLPELVVVGLVTGGLALVPANHWRLGLALLGGGLTCAAVFRLLLPPREVPLLVNRSRLLDVLALLVLGWAVLSLAYTLIYDPPFTLGD